MGWDRSTRTSPARGASSASSAARYFSRASPSRSSAPERACFTRCQRSGVSVRVPGPAAGTRSVFGALGLELGIVLLEEGLQLVPGGQEPGPLLLVERDREAPEA